MTMIYVILEGEDRIPILTATTLEKVEELLKEYMGMGTKFPNSKVEYLGFKPYDNKYYDIFQGVYSFKTEDGIETFIRYEMAINDLN